MFPALRDVHLRVSSFTTLADYRMLKIVADEPPSANTTTYCSTISQYIQRVRHRPAIEAVWQLVGASVDAHRHQFGYGDSFVAFVGTHMALAVADDSVRAGHAVDRRFLRAVATAIRDQVEELLAQIQGLISRRKCAVDREGAEAMTSRAALVGGPRAHSAGDRESPLGTACRLALATFDALGIGVAGSRAASAFAALDDHHVAAHLRQAVRLLPVHRASRQDHSAAFRGIGLLAGDEGLPQAYLPPCAAALLDPKRGGGVPHRVLLLREWTDAQCVPEELLTSDRAALNVVVVDQSVGKAHVVLAEELGFVLLGNVGQEVLWRLSAQLGHIPDADVVYAERASEAALCREHGIVTAPLENVVEGFALRPARKLRRGLHFVDGQRLRIALHETGVSEDTAAVGTTNNESEPPPAPTLVTIDISSSTDGNSDVPLSWVACATAVVSGRTAAEQELVQELFWVQLMKLARAHRDDAQLVPGGGFVETAGVCIIEGQPTDAIKPEAVTAKRVVSQALVGYLRAKHTSASGDAAQFTKDFSSARDIMSEFLRDEAWAPLAPRRGDPLDFTVIPAGPLNVAGSPSGTPITTTVMGDVERWVDLEERAGALRAAAVLAESLLTTGVLVVEAATHLTSSIRVT
jgi:hypothetical protein